MSLERRSRAAAPSRAAAALFIAVRHPTWAVLAVAGPALLAPAPVYAQGASDLAAAKQWFSEGLKLEEDGKWAPARERFERVEGVKQTAQTAFHIGLCHARTGGYVEAIVWLERAKERAQQSRAADVGKAAEAELATVRTKAGSVEVALPKDPRPVRVTVDGEESRTAMGGGPVPVDPGEHEVVVTFATGAVTKKVRVAEGEAAKMAFEAPGGVAADGPAAAVAPAGPPLGRPPTTPSDTAPSSGPGAMPWILIGAGAAAAGGGAVLMVTSIGKFRDVCPDVCPREKEAEATAARDSAIGPYYVGGALIGAGVIAAGIGTYILLTTPRGHAAAATPWLDLASGRAGLSGRF